VSGAGPNTDTNPNPDPNPNPNPTQVLFNTWLEAPLGVPQHAAASNSACSGAGSGEAATLAPPPPAPSCRPRAVWTDAPPTRREGVGSGGVGSVKAKIWLLGDSAGSQCPALGSARVWLLCGATLPQGGRCLLPDKQLLPWVLELASSRVADSSAVGRSGDERRRGQPERTRSVLAPAALEAALTEPTDATLFSAETTDEP
jgi:hypothetical protein